MSKLYSLQELATTKDLPGEEYNKLTTSAGYHRELQPKKPSAVSLPPSITQYSSVRKEGTPQQEKPQGDVPIYSVPDKSKKTKMILEPTEQEEREMELSRSHTLNSFFNIKPQTTVEEGVDLVDKSTRLNSSSPPPPLLPPKPGQKIKLAEDAGENEELVYAEASSKPLQLHSQRKTNEWSDPTKAAATAAGNISPFHLHAHYFQMEEGHFQRSFSAVDHKKRKGAHSRQPTKTDHDQLYDTALSLLETKEEEARMPEKQHMILKEEGET